MLSLENEHQEIVHRKTLEVSRIVMEFLVDTYQTWWASEQSLAEEPWEQVFVELMAASFHMMEHHILCRPLVVLDLAENIPEIMQSYDHVNQGWGRLLIRKGRWKRREEAAMQNADFVVFVTQEAAQEAMAREARAESAALLCGRGMGRGLCDGVSMVSV